MSETKVLDLEAAASKFPGGEAMLREMAELLLGETASLTTQMSQAFHVGNAAEVQRTAHTLKGAAELFGSEQVVSTSRQIEHLAKDGNLDDARSLLEELQGRADRLQNALQQFLAAPNP